MKYILALIFLILTGSTFASSRTNIVFTLAPSIGLNNLSSYQINYLPIHKLSKLKIESIQSRHYKKLNQNSHFHLSSHEVSPHYTIVDLETSSYCKACSIKWHINKYQNQSKVPYEKYLAQWKPDKNSYNKSKNELKKSSTSKERLDNYTFKNQANSGLSFFGHNSEFTTLKAPSDLIQKYKAVFYFASILLVIVMSIIYLYSCA